MSPTSRYRGGASYHIRRGSFHLGAAEEASLETPVLIGRDASGCAIQVGRCCVRARTKSLGTAEVTLFLLIAALGPGRARMLHPQRLVALWGDQLEKAGCRQEHGAPRRLCPSTLKLFNPTPHPRLEAQLPMLQSMHGPFGAAANHTGEVLCDQPIKNSIPAHIRSTLSAAYVAMTGGDTTIKTAHG